MNTSIFQIGQNSLTEFSNTCPGLLDSKYNINDVFLQEKGIKNNPLDKDERTKNKNKNLPDNIVRHQWMGLLVRIAKDKYMRSKKNYYF